MTFELGKQYYITDFEQDDKESIQVPAHIKGTYIISGRAFIQEINGEMRIGDLIGILDNPKPENKTAILVETKINQPPIHFFYRVGLTPCKQPYLVRSLFV